MLEVTGIEKRYRGRTILKNVSFGANPGEMCIRDRGGAQGAADAGSAPHDDNVVDGDFKEV